MTSDDYAWTLRELDRLINDPDVPIQAELIWCLLDEVIKWNKRHIGLITSPLKCLKEDLPLANTTEEQAIRLGLALGISNEP